VDYYKVLLVAPAGYGKTYSGRNLDRATTGFVNTENKPLPFRGDFAKHYRPKTLAETTAALVELAKDEKIKSIFMDSLSAVFEMVLLDCRAKYKGFDVWNAYNTEIQKFIDLIKRVPKEVFITAHYEILGIEGSQEKRVKVKGKELEGVIEREFTIVLFADKRFNDKGKPEYYFNLFQEGTSAKCPPDIFGEDTYRIPNDCKMIYDKIQEFKGVEAPVA
jgi:hypothetical protein